MKITAESRRWRRLFKAVFAIAIATLAIAGPTVIATAAPNSGPGPDGVGLPAGTIHHVWLIILENKSYDETFTGLNNNSYLWQTLPSEGVLLKNYYGTGHTSMDNYLALVSGQSPQQDSQGDCASIDTPFGSNSTITTTGSIGADSPNWNFGQVVSSLGANQPIGTTPATTNGCTYPTDTPTLFDQFNAAGITWKGYAQDLGGAQPTGSSAYVADSVPGREDGLCGAPGSALNNPASAPTYLSGAQGYPVGTPVVTSTLNSAATASGHTVLTDTSQTFSATDIGYAVQITGGTGAGEGGTVTAETGNTLTIAALPTTPDSTSTYKLGPPDTTSYTGASLVAGTGTTNNPQYSDQYVAKHFPFPWFASLTGGGASNPLGTPLTEPATGTNCDANHIANLDDPTHGLIADLTNNTVPGFSWITPNNCSDAHDTTCKGNNLSGAFGLYASGPHAGQVNLNDPIYSPSGLPAYDPEATTPRNYAGGLYASDLFLAYYLPLIEGSQAYQNGGLIDITFDEGEASFTYSGNSFNNVLTNSSASVGTPAQPAGQGTSSPQATAPADAPTYGTPGSSAPGAKTIYGAYGIAASAAGENINGTNVYDEPYGPNTTLQTDSNGNQLYPGPGDNLSIDRPPACTQTTPTLLPADCVPGILRGASGSSPGARTDAVGGGSGTNIINYPNPTSGNPTLVADDTGREITSITMGGTTYAYNTSAYNTQFPTGLFVGTVTDTGELYPANSGGPTVTASFQAIDSTGAPVVLPGSVTSVTLSAESDPATATGAVTADPLWDATDPTPGGGSTGSVLISKYIKPGTSSTVNYNHYSWLRTMEDLFNLSSCVGTSTNVSLTVPSGTTVCGGLDGQGHIGYAAQSGLVPFGTDVFTAADGSGFSPPPIPVNPGEGTPEAPFIVALPALAFLVFGGYLFMRRRRSGSVAK